jgi:hypothetical protein
VRFAVPREERPEFRERLRTLAEGLPIAAQFEWYLTEGAEAGPPTGRTGATVPTVWTSSEAHGLSP